MSRHTSTAQRRENNGGDLRAPGGIVCTSIPGQDAVSPDHDRSRIKTGKKSKEDRRRTNRNPSSPIIGGAGPARGSAPSRTQLGLELCEAGRQAGQAVLRLGDEVSSTRCSAIASGQAHWYTDGEGDPPSYRAGQARSAAREPAQAPIGSQPGPGGVFVRRPQHAEEINSWAVSRPGQSSQAGAHREGTQDGRAGVDKVLSCWAGGRRR